MKGVITIFAMPQELEDLALTLNGLKRNSAYIDVNVQYKVDITMCLSDELTDWENTKLPKEYFEERTKELCEKYLDWCEYSLLIETENEILGCVSQRRMSWKNNPDADFFIWLDTDMFFKDTTLYYASSAYQMVAETGIDMCVVTPQIVKQWDNTWDVLVNKKYWNEPVNYHLSADIFVESLPQLNEININEIPVLKFAGGWFTLISKKLIDAVGIPDSLGHYGLEDTFIMNCGELMRQKNIIVSQFIMENLIVGEIHTNRTNGVIKQFIASKDKKDEYRQVAHMNYPQEIQQFYEKINVN